MTEVHPTGSDFVRKRVRGRWDYVRLKLKRQGVVEVTDSHPHHCMLQCLEAGIKETLEQHPELQAKDVVSEEDYNHVLEKRVHSGGKTAVFKSYASSVFASVRRAVGISEEDYLDSLVPVKLPYLEFISNSRSGQDFYFSNNQRFILKTDKQSCVEFFLSILRQYLGHFLTYPHSLLVKFVGLYSIKMSSSRQKFLLVMQSIFYPSTRLEARYDIKGCLGNRYQKPNPEGKSTLIVLKDRNFYEEKIDLGHHRDWFVQQLEADVDFLRELGVQDYSLLLGRQPLHVSEQRETVGNLVVRMRKSFGTPLASDGIEVTHTDTPDKDSHELTRSGDGKPTPDEHRLAVANSTQHDSSNKHRIKTPIPRSLSDPSYLKSLQRKFQNQRLLLNCKNCLHIIDGTSERYFVGVIDFFTQWQCRQRVGKLFKDVKHCCKDHSTEPPDVYADRFLNFIVERTT